MAKYTIDQLNEMANGLRAAWDEHGGSSEHYKSQAELLVSKLGCPDLYFIMSAAFQVDVPWVDVTDETADLRRLTKYILSPYGDAHDASKEAEMFSRKEAEY